MKNKFNRSIFYTEYVKLNGIDQFLFHSGTSPEHPVMLYLHGGPGSVESLFTLSFQNKWEDLYTVVHWDQRGAGKTLTKNPDKLPTIELMLEDLHEVIQYLKNKYQKQKIVLFGHSWGTVLGTLYIRKHPKDVSYYIGSAQMVNLLENEQVAYNKLKEMVELNHDNSSKKVLTSIGTYPGDSLVFDNLFINKCRKIRKLQAKYDLALNIGIKLYVVALKSPIFKLSDAPAFFKAFKSNQQVFRFLESFNLNSESYEYHLPIYYLSGAKDWQVPFIITEDYFSKISAPRKKSYLIPNAGHMMMIEEPELVFEAISDICKEEGDR